MNTQRREYKCTKCQRIHNEAVVPRLFQEHLMFQDKHGWYWARPDLSKYGLPRSASTDPSDCEKDTPAES